jgi:acid phosphatase
MSGAQCLDPGMELREATDHCDRRGPAGHGRRTAAGQEGAGGVTVGTVRSRSFAPLLALVAASAAAASSPATAAVPTLDHIIVVVMENKDWAQVRDAPYTTSLRLSGAEFLNSYGVTQDASQPNYLAMWAGSTFGVTANTCPPPGSPYTAENLGHALEAAGKTWRAYSENLPSTGSNVCTSGGSSPLYTRKHDPWTDFSNLDHNNERVYSDLALDIANNTLPNLAYVIPNNCDNSHNTGCTVTIGDTWLSNNLPAMIAAVDTTGIVILTWDEDSGTPGNNNHILTVFKGPRVKSGYQSAVPVNHNNVLRTICEALGVAPMGQAAIDPPITDVWYEGALDVPTVAGGGIRLSAPMPNPSTGGVTAQLTLPEAARVEASIYDIAGHAIRRLMSGTRSGPVELRWDARRENGSPAGAGIYFLKVRAGARALQQKAVLLR